MPGKSHTISIILRMAQIIAIWRFNSAILLLGEIAIKSHSTLAEFK